jgi:RNA polymerase sigma factor (TIGR02999 family)
MTPSSPSRQAVTQLLGDWSRGDTDALERLIPLVEPELHRLAHHYMSRERAGHTLQTTALINEAYLRLVDNSKPTWQNRNHFVAAAAQLMRRIMVDHARERLSLKRGGGAVRVTLDETAWVTDARSEELLALDEALANLAALDSRKSQVVELRYFGGLTAEETAGFLNLSLRTVEREWNMAKAWLYRALSEKQPDEG